MKVGDIVRLRKEYKPWLGFLPEERYTGIVTKLYHEGHDVLVLLSDGRFFIDRVENFVVL